MPVVGAIRLNHDVQRQIRYCQHVEDPATPYYCNKDAVRLDVETRPNTW